MPIKIVSTRNMRLIEAAADAAGTSYDTMMQNAGRVTAQRVLKYLTRLQQARVTVIIGPGNNGGDGLVAGRIIAEASDAQVRFYLLRRREDDDPSFLAVRQRNLFIASAEDDQRYRVLQHMVASSDIIIDALFGIGIRLPIEGDAAHLLQAVKQSLNALSAEHPAIQTIDPLDPGTVLRAPLPHIFAVDCPSGLDCDTGVLDRSAIPADETITFIAAKPGLFRFPGAASVGHLIVSDIGVPENLPPLREETTILADSVFVRNLLPPRPPNAHKGTYGRAVIAAGSPQYIGAPGLAARAACRSGAGLVTVCTHDTVVSALAGHLPEVTWLPFDAEPEAKELQEALAGCDAVLLGPGWGRAQNKHHLLGQILSNVLPPTVIDADGLNQLAESRDGMSLLPQNVILTPHPGEMARLTNLTVSEIQTNRWDICRDNAVKWKAVVVLKGAHTVIASPEGQLVVMPFKTDALATAGTGDVLAGIITGLLAQGAAPFNAAVVGTYWHGLAGEIAAQRAGNARSVIAGDVIQAMGQAMAAIESH